MESILHFFKDNYALIMMPLTYGFIGWMTNIVALKMTFYPLKFVGIPPFLGWQGIIPKKSHKMASVSVDIITERLLKLEDLVDKIDPIETQNSLAPVLDKTLKDIIYDVIHSINSTLWNVLPKNFKESMLKNSKEDAKNIIKDLVENFKTNVDSFFSLKDFIVRNLTGDNIKLTVDMFQKIGYKELKFIQIAGLYFGFILGAIQIVLWLAFPYWWTLPLQGIVVGYLTNWLALKMIFRPLYPKKILGFTFQGLFLKRQSEVSKEYSHIVATKILSAKKILNEIFYGRAADKILTMIYKAISNTIDSTSSIVKPVITLTIGSERYNQIKVYVQDQITQSIPDNLKNLENYMDKTLDLENIMSKKMQELSPKEFEIILRSAFKEDEWLLILVGAVLGAFVGLGQAFLIV